MEEWAWWHFWQEKKSFIFWFTPNYYSALVQLLTWRQGRYFRNVPKPCDSCVFPLLFSPLQGWSRWWRSNLPSLTTTIPRPGATGTPAAGTSLGSKGCLWLRLVQHSPEAPSPPPANFQCPLTRSEKSTLRVWPPSLPQGKPHWMSRMGLTFMLHDLKLHRQRAFTFLQSFIKIPQRCKNSLPHKKWRI